MPGCYLHEVTTFLRFQTHNIQIPTIYKYREVCQNFFVFQTLFKTLSVIRNDLLLQVAILGQCSEEVVECAYQYGRNIGIAFQVSWGENLEREREKGEGEKGEREQGWGQCGEKEKGIERGREIQKERGRVT